MLSYLTLFSGWLLFFALHSLMADGRVKAFAAKITGSGYRFYRLGYNLFNLILFVALLVYQFSLPRVWFVQETAVWLSIPGAALLVSGFVIMAMAFAAFNRAEFIGIEQLQQKATAQPRPAQLTKTGLYAYVRHPLYSGIILMLFGALALQPSFAMLVFVLACVIYLPVGVWLEEKKLVAEFGEAYLQYRKEVKALLPFVF